MNGIIVIDKPSDWTSQDVCSKLRNVLREKRIGHGGTLDPMATGVLPIFCGRATRAVEFCENSQKSYIAGLRLGVTTDTQDTTGTTVASCDKLPSKNELLAVLPSFTGEQQQIPPMYSALKIGGKKLYDLARKGQTVDRKPRTITVYDITLLNGEGCDYTLSVTCSKGTYIRTLMNDIGEKLGCGGTMSSLRRTMAGGFSIEDAVTIQDVILSAENGTLNDIVKPVDSLFSEYTDVFIEGENLRRCLNGNEFHFPAEDGFFRVYDKKGIFLMLGNCENGTMKTVKSFFEIQ